MKSDFGLLVLRLGAGGFMMFAHGWGKLSGFSEYKEMFPDPIGLGSSLSLGLAVGAEFFCALAIVIGLFTRFASIPLVITMLVAALVVHADDPFQKKELALMYLVPFISLLLTGPGKFSVDHIFLKRE